MQNEDVLTILLTVVSECLRKAYAVQFRLNQTYAIAYATYAVCMKAYAWA